MAGEVNIAVGTVVGAVVDAAVGAAVGAAVDAAVDTAVDAALGRYRIQQGHQSFVHPSCPVAELVAIE